MNAARRRERIAGQRILYQRCVQDRAGINPAPTSLSRRFFVGEGERSAVCPPVAPNLNATPYYWAPAKAVKSEARREGLGDGDTECVSRGQEVSIRKNTKTNRQVGEWAVENRRQGSKGIRIISYPMPVLYLITADYCSPANPKCVARAPEYDQPMTAPAVFAATDAVKPWPVRA